MTLRHLVASTIFGAVFVTATLGAYESAAVDPLGATALSFMAGAGLTGVVVASSEHVSPRWSP